MSKQALGKGLGALIPASPVVEAQSGLFEIELSRIVANEYQPRKSFNATALAELADSIKANGVIQPVVVRKKESGGYQLIAGERRFRASKLAGLKKIPAIIKDVSPAESMEIALIENIQREDLNPIETADAYARLIKEFGLTQEDMAARVGKDRSTIANFLRLITLPTDIKKDLAAGSLSMGHAKAILSIDSAPKQLALRKEIITRGLSVREAEAAAKKLKSPGRLVKPSVEKPLSAQVAMLEDELKKSLGTRVRIKQQGRGGTIEIEFYSAEELDRLLDLLQR